MPNLSPTVDIPVVFSQNGDRNTIPNQPTPNPTGQASWLGGFPPETFLPVTGGGIPPQGQDFNGVFFALSQHVRFLQGGGFYTFNPTFSASVGGYPLGAMLQSKDGRRLYRNLVDGNQNDPDVDLTNWQALGLDLATEAMFGVTKIATTDQAISGIDDATTITPLKLKKVLDQFGTSKYNPGEVVKTFGTAPPQGTLSTDS